MGNSLLKICNHFRAKIRSRMSDNNMDFQAKRLAIIHTEYYNLLDSSHNHFYDLLIMKITLVYFHI